jgi:hypothetical protein
MPVTLRIFPADAQFGSTSPRRKKCANGSQLTRSQSAVKLAQNLLHNISEACRIANVHHVRVAELLLSRRRLVLG